MRSTHSGGRARGVATVKRSVSDAELQAMHDAGVRGVRFNFVKRLVDFTPKDELIEIAGRIAKLGWHVVIYFEAVDLPELWDFFTRAADHVVVDHMGRPDVGKPVDGPEFELFVKFMREHPNVWSKVSCPERLSVNGPPALNGEQNAYRDVIPFARRIVESFPDRVLWGTDWPHPNLKDHMPDDGLLVDFIPHIATTPELQRKLLVDNPMRLYWPEQTPEEATMSLDKPYTDIPGTTIFDAEQSRKGYHLNQFCMSLMKAENRERFKADERAYLDEWPMTRGAEAGRAGARLQPLHRARRQHLLPRQDRRDRRQELSADGRQHDRHERGGIPRHDDRRRPLASKATATAGREEADGPGSPPASTPRMCRPSARRSTSARPREPYWQPVFKGYEFSKQWMDEQSPTSSSWSTTTTPRPSASRSSRLSPSDCAEISAGRRGLGAAARCRW